MIWGGRGVDSLPPYMVYRTPLCTDTEQSLAMVLFASVAIGPENCRKLTGGCGGKAAQQLRAKQAKSAAPVAKSGTREPEQHKRTSTPALAVACGALDAAAVMINASTLMDYRPHRGGDVSPVRGRSAADWCTSWQTIGNPPRFATRSDVEAEVTATVASIGAARAAPLVQDGHYGC